jgi:hypothetical protein
MAKRKRKAKKEGRKVVKKNGRGPSKKSKASKVKKLIKLAKSKKGKKK